MNIPDNIDIPEQEYGYEIITMPPGYELFQHEETGQYVFTYWCAEIHDEDVRYDTKVEAIQAARKEARMYAAFCIRTDRWADTGSEEATAEEYGRLGDAIIEVEDD